MSKIPEAQPLVLQDPNNQADVQKTFTYLVNMMAGAPVKALMTPAVAGTIWKENVKIADENNHPGKFTAFCSYEWTSMPNFRNLHEMEAVVRAGRSVVVLWPDRRKCGSATSTGAERRGTSLIISLFGGREEKVSPAVA